MTRIHLAAAWLVAYVDDLRTDAELWWARRRSKRPAHAGGGRVPQ